MKDKKLRRLLAGASTAAIAVGFATSFGVMAASAAPVSVSTTSGSWTFNRTISNGTPVPGDTITVTNNIRWNGGLAPTISAFKDIHPDCLTYVADSSRVSGKGVTTDSTNSTFVRMTGSWIRSAVDRNIDYTVQYTVGQNCARDVALITGAGISANQNTGSETANAGPSITVAKAATQTTLAVAPAPQADRASTLTATVTAGVTGNVDFFNNGNLLGTGTIASGTATYAWTPAGADGGQPYSITAKYLSDATNAVSTSAPQTGTVAAAPTVPAAPTEITVNPTSVVVGGTVTVSGKAEANSEVTVIAGDKTCKDTANAAGAFSCDIVTSEPGTLTVTAVAANTVGVGPISASVTVAVSAPADIDTTLGLSVPSVATTGVAVDLTAAVTPASAVGSVSFKVAGAEVGTASVSNGVATLSHAFAVAGVQSVTADFAGAGFVASSAGPSLVTVSDPVPADVDTALGLTVPAVASTGVAVDLTATVAPANAAGTVQFQDNGVDIGSAVSVVGGVGTVSHAFGSAGAHSITASFTAGAGFNDSVASDKTVTVSDPVAVDVDTTLGLTVPSVASTGVAVDLTAAVTPASAVGSVSFKIAGVEVGTASVSNGVATLSHAFAVAGVQSVTADFAGAGFVASSAGPSLVTVSDAAVVDTTSTTVLSVAGEAKVGVELDLSAAVAGQPSGDPAPSGGTVAFKVDGVSVGSVPVVNGAATMTHTFNVAGTVTVTAVYSGSGTLAGSTSNAATVNVTVEAPTDVDTTTTLNAPASGVVGKNVQLKANVSPLGSVGTVQFFEGNVPLGTAVNVVNGVAVLDHTFAAAGNHSITAVFSGGPGMKASESAGSTINVTEAETGIGGSGSLGNIFGS
ncbi:beta strand repeat-containing protein [Rhodococcus sp. NPDC056743]|uniref:beta strand repeat-containing protein n=1 Tax=Rhodococcus sp. NPDC056743 TaxID=3345934 RepID=UPI003671A4EA